MSNPYEDPLCSQKYERRMRRRYIESGKCVYCGADKQITKDHIKPKSRGGDNSLDNLQPLCSYCNKMKGSHTELELKIILQDIQDHGVWYQFEKPYQKYLNWLLNACEIRGHVTPLLK